MATTLLLIYDILETIQYAWAILNIIILGHYILHNDKIFRYMEYILYKLEKIKIVLKYY